MKMPQRLAYHIFIRLTGHPFYHADDILKLRAQLPSCTQAVVADERVIVLATITEDSESELLARCKEAIRHEAITVVELGRRSASTDGAIDPFHSWMEGYVRGGSRGQVDNPEDVLKRKWGQGRRESSENRGIADTIRKVFPGTTWPRKKGV